MKRVYSTRTVTNNILPIVETPEFQRTPAFQQLFHTLQGYLSDVILRQAEEKGEFGDEQPSSNESLNFVRDEWAFQTTKKIFSKFLNNELHNNTILNVVDNEGSNFFEDNGYCQQLINEVDNWYKQYWNN